nr:hypothetical protein [Tanacetum cinerariifolium]
MTTPRPTPFSTTAPRARVFTLFFIISDSDDEITTLPMRPAPPLPDRTPALYVYPLDYGDDSSDEDLSDIVESLHTQSASTLVEDKVVENISNKRKWEGNHKGSSSQQQNKEPKVIRAHTARTSNKEGYARNLPLRNKYEFHHTSPCVGKCGNCKWFGHQTIDCSTPILRAKQRPLVAKQKAKVTCYECGLLGNYKSNCPMWKFQKRVNKYWKEKALRDSSIIANNVDVSGETLSYYLVNPKQKLS